MPNTGCVGERVEEVPVSVDGHLHGVSRSFWGGRALAFVFVILALLISATTGLLAAPASAAETVEYSDSEIAFVTQLNDYRVANGRQPLLISDTLSLSAQRHSSDMGKYRYFDHYTQGSDWFPRGYSPFQRMGAVGYSSGAMGENIAAGQLTAASALAAFQGSEGHNALLLSTDYAVVGIGLVNTPGSPYGYYWTVDFGGTVDSSAHGTGIFEQSDSRISYLGEWNSAGTFYWANHEGSTAFVSFTGTAIQLYAQTGQGYGQAKVSVDGGAATTVDFNTPSGLSRQPVYTKYGLPDTTHTVKITCVSEGQAITLDALRVWKTQTQPGELVQAPNGDQRYQQDNGAFRYTGDWVDCYTPWLASGWSYWRAEGPGASVNVTFDGTSLTWIGTKASNQGKALVVLDGVTAKAQTVDLYSANEKYKQKIYSTGVLSEGRHTLAIYWVGEKNPAATNYYVNVDAFDVLGGFTQAQATAPPFTWTYEQNASKVTYLGDWATGSSWSASGGSFASTEQKGAAAITKFNGTEVTAVLRTTPWYGKAELTLDPGTPQQRVKTVDLYSASVGWKVTSLYKETGLAAGEHTLVVRCAGLKNDASLGTAIGLDGFAIKGQMLQAPAAARIDDTTASFAFAGDWNQAQDWYASGDSFRSANSQGAKVTFTFQGNYASLLARTTPWYGWARVTLDGNEAEAVIVDLYSPGVAWQVSVYNTGYLASGAHYLTVEWLDEKCPASWATGISVDAAEILAIN